MSLVAFCSDFGLSDPFVAEVKLALRRHGPADLRVLDITHEIAPGAVAAGRWVCARIWPQLPAGAVLLAVVDPGVGSERPAVAAAAGGRFFVGPGNGLFTGLAAEPDLQVVRLVRREPPLAHLAGTTFDGRDLFAPAAARLAAGQPLRDLGTPASAAELGDAPPEAPCAVVWIDRFGNLITNLCRDSAAGRRLAAGATLMVAGRPVRGPIQAYADAAAGELVWYWGSGGTMEIARAGASAAAQLSARTGLVISLPVP
ncbi:MAG: SAM-dependent chlorinase/fluorinase [Candidatus Krumholzibacteria bacterium]|nr:SAM-dependent chlorinase/fluorinase [Candidatus Krumholzibacteria bacterium]